MSTTEEHPTNEITVAKEEIETCIVDNYHVHDALVAATTEVLDQYQAALDTVIDMNYDTADGSPDSHRARRFSIILNIRHARNNVVNNVVTCMQQLGIPTEDIDRVISIILTPDRIIPFNQQRKVTLEAEAQLAANSLQD